VSALLELILANALGAGLLALAAWVLSRRIRRQALMHGLWVLALVKLVTPPIVPLPLLPEWSLPAAGLPEGPAVVVIEAAPSKTRVPLESGRAASAAGIPEATELLLTAEGLDGPTLDPGLASSRIQRPPTTHKLGHENAASRWSGPDVLPLVGLALLVGAFLVATLAGLRIRRFGRLLDVASPAPAALSARTSVLARRLGLGRAPPVLLLPARVPPMLWPGRGGPSLLMPADLLPELTEEERDTLLLHELAHVRRRDHWVRFLELAVTTVFWWYPVTWWIRRALRRAEERCCDEWVLRVMPASASAYAEGLIKSLDFVAGEPAPLPIGASGAAGPVRDLEARLKEILMMTPKPHLATPTRLVLAGAAALGLAVFPTQAQPTAPTDGALEAPAVETDLPPRPPAPVFPDAAPPAPAIADTAAPAPPAPPAATPPPVLAEPVSPAPPAEGPALAPLPSPALLAPPTPAVASPRPVVAPRPAPAPAPNPVVAPRPAPAPVVLPQAPEDEAAFLEIEEEHRRLAEEQARLEEKELGLAQERMAREAAAQQKHLAAEVERLRADGETEKAQRLEDQARVVAERMEVQRRQLELERARVKEQRETESLLLAKEQKLRQAEAADHQEEAEALQAEIEELEREHTRGEIAHERQRLELHREALETERSARLAELDLDRQQEAEVTEERMVDLEREQERMEKQLELERREIEAREAEQRIHAKELALREIESAGRAQEAEAARAEIERMRREVDEARLGLQHEHLLRATDELKLQMESQLDALHDLQEEGSLDADLEAEIGRLEAALEALQ
jgi:beta-lactamase regulating signal transducer with metallopeptidase domain